MIHWHYIAWFVAALCLVGCALGYFAAGQASREVTSDDTKLPRWLGIVGVALILLTLAACGPNPPIEQPVPIVEVKEVKVPTPVPCKALERLGPAPAYADTDAAIAAAPDIWELGKLYAKGRLQRIQRGAAMEAARLACMF